MLPLGTKLLSKSIGASHSASKNHGSLGPVVIAKRERDGLSVIIKCAYPNHRERKYRVGYIRFGKAPLWIDGIRTLLAGILSREIEGKALDLSIIEEITSAVLAEADRVAATPVAA